MAKPKHIDLTEDGVITQQALLAYAEGRLSDAERAEMDRLLRDDPFAQEALDGLRKAPNATEVSSAIITLNTQLREKTGVRERKKKGIEIHWANYAYAAVVLGILIGVGFVMIRVLSSEHHEEAMNKPVPRATVSAPVVEEKKKEEPQPDTTRLVSGPTDSLSKNPATDTKNNAAAADLESKKAEAKAPVKEMSPADAARVASLIGEARALFGSGDYVSAEKKYKEILAMQPDNSDALYFGGVCAFYNSSPGFGEANFDKLAKTNQYTEGAKWYKAEILIKKGKKDEAKSLLRDLINSNGYFKERAVKEYESLYNSTKQ